jgi:hypothetical protein
MEVLTYPGLKPINWADPPKATTRVASDYICTDGKRLTGSMRTVCHNAWLMAEAKKHGLTWQVIQPAFNTGVPASAGTHDFDACEDGRLIGLSWWEGQKWLRARGFWCWWRHTGSWASPSAWHFHGFTAPRDGWHFDTKVGIFVPGQLVDFHNHAFGLANQHVPGSDDSWFPPDLSKTIFNLAAFVRQMQEENMEYKDWSKESKDALADDVANRILNKAQVVVRTPDNTSREKITVRQAIGRAANATPLVRDQKGDIKELSKAVDDLNK